MNIRIDGTRERILKVASRIFARFGYQKTTVDEIAESANKAKGSIYYYYKSKDDLFRDVVEHELNQVKAQLDKVVNGPEELDYGKKLMQYVNIRMKALSKAVNYHQVIRNNRLQKNTFISRLRKQFDLYELQSLRCLLKKGVQCKQFNIGDVNLAASAFYVTLKGLDFSLLLNQRYSEFKNDLDRITFVVVRGLKDNRKDS